MNREQVIAKTLRDMRGCGGLNNGQFCCRSKELDQYDRNVTIPYLMQRLPDGEIGTCEDLDVPVGCCDSCHYFYAHFDMELVDLPDGEKVWVCCAVRRALFHEPDRLGSVDNVNLEEALGGRKDPNHA
jgi:hypothetical protein